MASASTFHLIALALMLVVASMPNEGQAAAVMWEEAKRFLSMILTLLFTWLAELPWQRACEVAGILEGELQAWRVKMAVKHYRLEPGAGGGGF